MTSQVSDWRDEVIYQLLVDRFANGDTSNDYRVDINSLGRYQGGDWQGVIDHMDYLDALGVTTIWISPIVRNVDTDSGFDGYHGYWASDLALLNPHFGDLATLRALVRTAHQHHIKVILDIVTNHMGQMFYYDINNNGQPDEIIGGSGQTLPGDTETAHTLMYEDPGSATSAITRNTEYDPDFNFLGPIQGFSSLGPSGDAPIIFLDMPEIFRIPPSTDILPGQAILARPEGYHRRGRIVSYDNNPGTHQPMPQVLLGDFPGGLKDVATERQDVRDFMVDAYWRWVSLTDLDGFRIDTLKHVEHEFWQYFATHIRQRAMAAGKSNFLLFGEAFDGDDILVGSFTNPNEMDSVFYFPQKYRVFDNIFQCGAGATQDAQGVLTDRGNHYGNIPQPLGVGVSPQSILVNFMDNHDVSRFLYGMNPTTVQDILATGTDCTSGMRLPSESVDSAVQRLLPRLHAAQVFQLTEDGIPCVYYGTEQEFHGGNDPSNRERLWDTGFPTSGATFQWLHRLIQIRRTYVALRRGTMAYVWVTTHTGTEPDVGMMAYERVSGSDYALVVIHAHDGNGVTMDTAGMTVHEPPGTVLTNVLGTSPQTVTVGSDGTVAVSLGPWQSGIFVPTAQQRALQ